MDRSDDMYNTLKGTRINNKENSYRIQYYNGDQSVMVLKYVNFIEKGTAWLKEKNITWTHAMVYDRRKEDRNEAGKIGRIYNPEL